MQSWGFKFILGAALEIRCKLRHVRMRERDGTRGGFFAENIGEVQHRERGLPTRVQLKTLGDGTDEMVVQAKKISVCDAAIPHMIRVSPRSLP
jgi:hypothetical protein